MSQNKLMQELSNAPSRSDFMRVTGLGALSATAVALLGGISSVGMAAEPASDVAILNVALGLEYEAIAAYQIGAESGLLHKPNGRVLKNLWWAAMFRCTRKESYAQDQRCRDYHPITRKPPAS